MRTYFLFRFFLNPLGEVLFLRPVHAHLRFAQSVFQRSAPRTPLWVFCAPLRARVRRFAPWACSLLPAVWDVQIGEFWLRTPRSGRPKLCAVLPGSAPLPFGTLKSESSQPELSDLGVPSFAHWLCSLALLPGSAPWLCSLALLPGSAPWLCSLALPPGSAPWLCSLALLPCSVSL